MAYIVLHPTCLMHTSLRETILRFAEKGLELSNRRGKNGKSFVVLEPMTSARLWEYKALMPSAFPNR